MGTLHFKEYLFLEESLKDEEGITHITETKIEATGFKAPRHAIKYVMPFIGKKDTHTLNRKVGNLEAGSTVSIKSSRIIDGKHFAMVRGKHGEKYEQHEIPHSYMEKPKGAVVKHEEGFKKENELADKLKARGMMDKETKTAGSTGGVDFHIINKKKGIKYGGKVSDQIGGESKISLKAKMGAISLAHTKEKGWHVSEKSKKQKPHFAAALEKATVNGKPLLKHLNKHWGEPTQGKRLPQVTTDSSDLHPVHAYMKDHHADVLHIHTHGTFRGGVSEDKDRTGVGFPKPKGTGRFTIGRERADGPIHAAFRAHEKEFSKSHLDLMNDEHLDHIAKKLGHK